MKRLFLPLIGSALLLAACGGGGSPQPTSDTAAPTITLSAAQSGTAVNLSAAASDNVAVTRVEFYRGSTLLNTDTAAPYAFADAVSLANNGNVAYSAKAYDAAGNVGQDSKTVTVNVTPPIKPPGKTLYQGVWGWGVINLTTLKLIDNGAVLFSAEDQYEGRTVGAGAYINIIPDTDQPGDRAGFAFLGPITGAGKLETIFSLDISSNRIYFAGVDDNDTLELFDGKPTFDGVGSIADASNNPGQQVGILLIQVSDTVPTGAAALKTIKARANTFVASAVKANFETASRVRQPAHQMTPELLKAAQQVLQINR